MDYIDNLLRLDAINYWRYEYTIRHILYKYGEDNVDKIRNRIEYLQQNQDSNFGNDVIRYTLHAMVSLGQFGESLYDISYLKKDDLNLYTFLLEQSFKYGYSADFLFQKPIDALELVTFIKTNKKTPPSPPPFMQPDQNNRHIVHGFVMLELSKLGKNNYEFYSIGCKDIEKIKRLDEKANSCQDQLLDELEDKCNYSDLSLDEKILHKAFYSYLRHNAKDRENLHSTWIEKQKNDFLNRSKKIYPVSFQTKSNISRAIGLYMWDSSFFKFNVNQQGAISVIRSKFFVKDDDNKSIENDPDYDYKNGGPDDTFFNKKFKKTEKCIECLNVLSI